VRRIFAERGQAVIRDLPIPELRPGEILVRTHASTVSSGTESWILRRSETDDAEDEEYPGARPFVHPNIRSGIRSALEPRRPIDGLISLGYSLAGVVEQVGEGVTDLAPGDPVACSGSQCAHHAEYVAVPRNLAVRVPHGVALGDASFVTLGAVAEEALRRTECHFGETVVLYGMGLLGLLAGQIAQAAGLYVIGLDIDHRRLDQARALGITDVHDPREVDDLVELARSRTDGFGADAVVLGVVTESSEPVNTAFRMCRQRGRVVGLGLFGIDVERANVWDRTYVHAIAYGPGRYDPSYEEGNVDYPIGLVRWTENRNQGHFLRLLAEGRVRVDGLAVRYPLGEAPDAYRLLRSPERPPTIQFDYGLG
jgi:threonine dehydrogenase-like Zn-dependent dehydrogenase